MKQGSFLRSSTEEAGSGASKTPQHPETHKDRRWLRIARHLAPVVMALVVSLVCLTTPRVPVTTDRESSWGAALSYAHEKGLQFGSQIVFTYGPLGFLTIPYFCSHAAAARLATDFTLCFGIMMGVCLLAWQLGVFWRWLLLGLFIFFSANLELKLDLLVYFGLVCWALLCFVGSGP